MFWLGWLEVHWHSHRLLSALRVACALRSTHSGKWNKPLPTVSKPAKSVYQATSPVRIPSQPPIRRKAALPFGSFLAWSKRAKLNRVEGLLFLDSESSSFTKVAEEPLVEYQK